MGLLATPGRYGAAMPTPVTIEVKRAGARRPAEVRVNRASQRELVQASLLRGCKSQERTNGHGWSR